MQLKLKVRKVIYSQSIEIFSLFGHHQRKDKTHLVTSLVVFLWLCLFFVVVIESCLFADDGRKGWKFRLIENKSPFSLSISTASSCLIARGEGNGEIDLMCVKYVPKPTSNSMMEGSLKRFLQRWVSIDSRLKTFLSREIDRFLFFSWEIFTWLRSNNLLFVY